MDTLVDANNQEVKVTRNHADSLHFIFTTGASEDVKKKFIKNSAPFLEVLNESEVGRSNIQFLQEIPTLVYLDPTLPYRLPDALSTVQPTKDKLIKMNGQWFLSSVNIIPDKALIKESADSARITLGEKMSSVLAVEVGHLQPKQIRIDQAKKEPTFAKQYTPLLNTSIRAAISYRQAKGLPLDDSLFAPLDKFITNGFVLDKDLQKLRNRLIAENKGK